MKPAKWISRAIISLLILPIGQNTLAQSETKDTFEKTFALSATGSFTLKTYDSNIEIAVWEKNEVKIVGEMIYKGGDKEDIEKLLKAFRNIDAESSDSKLEIDTEFIESQTTVMGMETKITLKSGEKIKMDKVKTEYKLWVPSAVALALNSKYNNVKLADLKGNVDLYLYDVDVTMGNFGAEGKFDAKYSNIKMGNGGKSGFTLYDSDIETGELSNVNIDAKYSNVEIKKAGEVEVTSYDDDFVLGSLINLKANAKYSSFRIESDINESKFDLYDSDVHAKAIKLVVFDAKYSDLNSGNIGEIKISSSYDSNYYLGIVGKITCNDSKYDMFKIQGVYDLAEFSSVYDGQLEINGSGKEFAGLSGKFTYGSVSLKLDPTLNFNLNFSTTYGKVKFPTSKFGTKSITEQTDSKHKFEGSTSGEAKCNIEFTGYSTNFTIE